MTRALRRLPQMGPEEVRYRLREALRRGYDRAQHALVGSPERVDRFLDRLPRPFTGARDEPGVLAYLRNRAVLRFYPAVREPERSRLRSLVERRFPGSPASIAAEAERLCEHRFECLGLGEVACGEVIDWHRDPVTGRQWAKRFWGDYDLVHDPGAGDPKRICELNRHQHLPRLAKAYLLLGDERYAREVVSQMLGWIDQNPPGVGIHWHSSLEIALRAVSWMWALFPILPSRALDEGAARRIGASLFAQLDHVHAYPSIASSPNTHLLGEATTLFVAGVVFQECAGACDWRERGEAILAGEIDRQVLPDGVHAELSTWYHCYAVDSYLQVLELSRATGVDLSLRLRKRTGQMLDFLLQMARPDGTLPRLGDDDGGRALALGATHYGRIADLLALGAVALRRGDLKHRAGSLDEAAIWRLGSEGCRELDELPSTPPPGLEASFPDAGYFVHRSGWGPRDSQLVFDCGGLGALGGGHGHADALSVTLFAHGEELLVDPGTFVYNGHSAWRDAFRSTRAHNTVRIDGRDQAQPRDTFRWESAMETELLTAASFEGIEIVAGEHDGYTHQPEPVVHRRRVLYVRPSYWLILDDFRGRGEHGFEIWYHLAPGLELRRLSSARATEARFAAVGRLAGLDLFLVASSELTVETHRGEGDAPGPGWVSSRYGEKRRARSLVARFEAGVPATCLTVLAPCAADRVGELGLRSIVTETLAGAGPALGVEVRARRGTTDLAVLSCDGSWVSTSALCARGEVLWARFEQGALRRFLSLDGEGLLYEESTDGGPVAEYAPAAPRPTDRKGLRAT